MGIFRFFSASHDLGKTSILLIYNEAGTRSYGKTGGKDRDLFQRKGSKD